jgi:hypothetical protein
MANLRHKIFIVFLLLSSCKEPASIKTEDLKKEIETINATNRAIKSLSCESRAGFSSYSSLFYEKPSKVILETYVFGRKEAFIYADNKYWLWIRNFDASSVYHCSIEDIDNTLVRDPFKPKLIKAALCIDEIPLDDIVFVDGKVKFSEENYDRTIVLHNGKIKEQHWNKFENPILSLYVLEHQEIEEFIIPKVINVVWHEIDDSIKVQITKVQINKNKEIPPIPSNLKQIDLKNY